MRRADATWGDPYACGVALGLVLLASYAVAQRGLGASGAWSVVVAHVVAAVAPAHAADHAAHGVFLDVPPWRDWLVLQVLGMMLGAWASATIARGVMARRVPGGRRVMGPPVAARWGPTIVGGALMACGARLAGGCTSGLALSGGALFSTGGWLFLGVAFGVAHACAPWSAGRGR